MKKATEILSTVLFVFLYVATAQSDTLTLRRADGTTYELEGEVKRYEDGNFVKDVEGWNKARWGMTEEQIKTVFTIK